MLNAFQHPWCRRRSSVPKGASRIVGSLPERTAQTDEWILKQVQDDEHGQDDRSIERLVLWTA